MKSLLLAVALLCVPLAHGQKVKDEGWSELLPPGNGRELVLNTCTGCHNLKVVVEARRNRAAWAKSVNDMIQRGAQLFPEEIDPITTYLSTAFAADTPKLVNVNTATREDLEKLPGFTPEIVTRILEARGKSGSFKNAEELRSALGMKSDDFEKIRYRLAYRG